MCLRFYSGEVNRQGLLLISIKLRDSISIYPNLCCHYLGAQRLLVETLEPKTSIDEFYGNPCDKVS